MQGVYTASFQATGVNSARSLMILEIPSTRVIELYSVVVTNANVTTAEQLDVAVDKITTLGTPTGTSVTPRAIEGLSAASGVTVLADITASEPTYAGNPFGHQGVANASGYVYEPLPEQRPILGVSTNYGVRLLGSPANSYTLDIEVSWRELG